MPGRLIASGFAFKFPCWGDAGRDLCHQWKVLRKNDFNNGLWLGVRDGIRNWLVTAA